MKKRRIIIALGGNAIHNKGEKETFEAQLENISKTMESVADILVSDNYEAIITHGNGPQVGALMARTAMPIHVCGAMSQSEIGYLIQQGLGNAFKKRGVSGQKIATIVTQIIVDKNCPNFKNPTKPVGDFYTKEEAEKLAGTLGRVFKEDSGRGWRRVVPSPMPLKIVEIESIKTLIKNGTIVICNGGGGIPVIMDEDGKMSGIDAVIDKDYAAALLGNNLNADALIILTTVEKVFINYLKPNQAPLCAMNCEKARQYLKEGHFAEGSMGPKIEAAIAFVEKDRSRKAIITNASALKDAVSGKNGTLITY